MVAYLPGMPKVPYSRRARTHTRENGGKLDTIGRSNRMETDLRILLISLSRPVIWSPKANEMETHGGGGSCAKQSHGQEQVKQEKRERRGRKG